MSDHRGLCAYAAPMMNEPCDHNLGVIFARPWRCWFRKRYYVVCWGCHAKLAGPLRIRPILTGTRTWT